MSARQKLEAQLTENNIVKEVWFWMFGALLHSHHHHYYIITYLLTYNGVH